MIIENLLAAILALILMTGLTHASEKVIKQESLGLGDAQLASLGGAWLGIEGITFAICLAFITAASFSVVGLLTKKLHLLTQFPFAPFIAGSIRLMWLFEPSWWIQQWLNLWGI